MKLSILAALPENKINVFHEKLSIDFTNFNYFPFPVIELEPKKTALESLDFNIIDEFDYLLFTSSYAASLFFDWLKEHQIELNGKIEFISVGPSISEVIEINGYRAALTADVFNAKGLAEKISETIQIKSKKFLLIVGQKSNSQILEQTITDHGGLCSKLALYSSKTITNPNWENLSAFLDTLQKLKLESFICISSPECVRAFSELLLSYKDFVRIPDFKTELITQNIKFICLGTATKDLVKDLFPFNKALIGSEYSYQGMIESIKSTENQ